jgi:PAB1-binding protein PBP1
LANHPDKVPALNIARKEKLTQTLAALLVFFINQGTICVVKLKNGTKYEGIYDHIDPSDLSTKIRLARKVGEDKLVSHMDILGKDIVSIEFQEIDNLAGDIQLGFQTDTAISKVQGPAKERVLQKWVPDEADNADGVDLECKFMLISIINREVGPICGE